MVIFFQQESYQNDYKKSVKLLHQKTLILPDNNVIQKEVKNQRSALDTLDPNQMFILSGKYSILHIVMHSGTRNPKTRLFWNPSPPRTRLSDT